MNDIEQVIFDIERCTCHVPEACRDCSKFERGVRCMEALLLDALELLRKQESVLPVLSIDTWICSKCGHSLESQELIDDKESPQILVHEQYQYCPNCGRKVKWDA